MLNLSLTHTRARVHTHTHTHTHTHLAAASSSNLFFNSNNSDCVDSRATQNSRQQCSLIEIKIKKSQQPSEIHLFHYQTRSITEVRYSTVPDHSVWREKVLKDVLDVPDCMVDVLDSDWASLWRASAVEDCSSLSGCGMGVVCVCVCVG